MNFQEALQTLELTTLPEDIEDHYRKLRSRGHPNSWQFDGVIRNMARLREAYDVVMNPGVTWTLKFSGQWNSSDSSLDAQFDEIRRWIADLIREDGRKGEQLDSLFQEYFTPEEAILIQKDTPVSIIKGGISWWDFASFDGILIDKYFYTGLLACAIHGIDQKKFIAFYEVICIPLLIAEIGYKFTMDSIGGIEFFADWADSTLSEYKSQRTVIGIIDEHPDITKDCPQFVKEIRKYYSRIPEKVQEELDFS